MYGLDLTDMDWKIIHHIEDHAACSKENVVKNMNLDASRITVLNKLDRLESDGYIIAKKDKPNSQIYKLYVNQKDLLVNEHHELRQFKKALLDLLSILRQKRGEIDRLYYLKYEPSRGPGPNCYRPADTILIFYGHLTSVYTSKSILEWSKVIKDNQILQRIYEAVFRQLYEIQESILKFLPSISGVEQDLSCVFSMLNTSFVFIPERIDIIIEIFERYNLLHALKPVIDSLWRISSHFVPLIIKPYQGNAYTELMLRYQPEMGWEEFLKIWRDIKGGKFGGECLHYHIDL